MKFCTCIPFLTVTIRTMVVLASSSFRFPGIVTGEKSRRFWTPSARSWPKIINEPRFDVCKEASINVASINHFTSQVYSGSDLRTTSFALANAGRDFIGCDRLSVLLPDGSKYRVHAVSGVDTINARSQAIRNMEQLAERTARVGEDFWYGRTKEELPGQLSSLVESAV